MRRIRHLLGALSVIGALVACGSHPTGWVASGELGGIGPRAVLASAPGLRRGGAEGRKTVVPPPAPVAPAPSLPGRRQKDLAGGKFLIATPQLMGPFFAQTVVLLLQYGAGGAVGLVVNRPTPMGLTKLLPDMEALKQRADKVYLGGPVDPHAMFFLIRSEQEPPHSQLVVGDVHASASSAALRHALEKKAPATHFRAYVGYAGWAPGQLDAEVKRGDWYVAPAQPEQIFAEKAPDLWQKLIREYGGVQVRAIRSPELARASLP